MLYYLSNTETFNLLLVGTVLHISVADPHHINAVPDSDPACHFYPDPAYHFVADPDPDPTFQFDADPNPDQQHCYK